MVGYHLPCVGHLGAWLSSFFLLSLLWEQAGSGILLLSGQRRQDEADQLLREAEGPSHFRVCVM